jgi:type VII secretion ATPase EccA
MFDQAVRLQAGRDNTTALGKFTQATEADPMMADAWLGRITSGDHALPTLVAAFSHGERLHRESRRLGVRLKADIPVGPYLVISASEHSHVGIGLAAAYVDEHCYAQAAGLLDDPALTSGWECWQWCQHVRAYLMYATQRWPDVIAEAAAALPAGAIIDPAITAATCLFAAMSAAYLGQSHIALEWAATAHTENTCVAAELAYARGMVYRQLGDDAKAQTWLGTAALGGQLIEPAKAALKDRSIQLAVVDEDEIATRADRWDPSTQKNRAQQRAEENAQRRIELLAEGKRLLERQIGLTEVKDKVRLLEDQLRVRAIRLQRGLSVQGQTNHILLVGPPGTGKTTTAEALGMIYCGLGIVRDPEVIEVKRADFCGEHIGASGPKTNELIERSLGRILFMDEIYSLIEHHQEGRPDMIGNEAVNQLLIALEVHRLDFCFMGTGYEDKVDEFLAVNPGLASRFNGRLRFASYSPAELVEIGEVYSQPRDTVLDAAARAEFLRACTQLSEHLGVNDRGVIESGIDLVHNGRFARNVVEKAEQRRDSRIARQVTNSADTEVGDDELKTIRREDIRAALVDACAERHISINAEH